MTLQKAVASFTRPGMKLHIAGGIGGDSAAICEIIRRYYGKNPGFTLIQNTVTGHALNLLACNLLKKMVFSACVDISTSGRPSRVMQQKWADKSIEFENWSLCSLQQRLMAGALGVPFFPTRSISGSRMAGDNRYCFQEINNPFGDETTGVVAALIPDISIVHGCVADELGNTILGIPYGDDIWGSLASAGGVIVTVEKIVSGEVIRTHSPLVKIPGHRVRAVCEVPLGLHPFSLANPGLDDFTGYESDVEFLNELHSAFRSDETLTDWLKEWVLDSPTNEDYLRKLGKKKIDDLYRVKTPSSSPGNTMYVPPGGFTAEEMMLVAASREIIESIQSSNLKLVLLGAGSRSTGVLLAYRRLKAMDVKLEIITGNGQYGYDPLPGELGLQSLAGVYSSKMVMDTIMAQGILIGGNNNDCLSVLGAGQVDKFGNTNSTLSADGRFLVGSGGANDTGNAREVIVILNQAKDRFTEKTPYITCPGSHVTKVISTMGIFKKPASEEELRLVACLPDADKTSLERRIQRIQENCSWPLNITEPVTDVPEPSEEELKELRLLM